MEKERRQKVEKKSGQKPEVKKNMKVNPVLIIFYHIHHEHHRFRHFFNPDYPAILQIPVRAVFSMTRRQALMTPQQEAYDEAGGP
jgi:hypothetical protein